MRTQRASARWARRARGEDGETLLELLVTVTIMGIAFVAILAGVAVAITASDSLRDEAVAEGVVRNYAERVADPDDVPYVDCAPTSAYATPPGFAVPAGWSASVTAVAYWQGNNPPTFGGSCPSPDRGLQQVTLRVQSPAGQQQATETVVVVKRRP